MLSPPVYRSASTLTLLPAYSPRQQARPSSSGSRGSTEHVFFIKDNKQRTCATLKLFSSAPSPNSSPTFLGGDRIAGSLALSVSSGERITEVSIEIRGEIVGRPLEDGWLVGKRFPFLNIAVPLWSKTESSLAPSGSSRWPFILDMPKTVALPDPDNPRTAQNYSLPQTFLERNTDATVNYYLSVRILRSARLFREDNRLEHETMFVYVPAVRPDPPSPLRQLAYQENTPIPGPEIDLDGWYTHPTVRMKGTVFNNRKVEIHCAFSLAKPLCYTRGSVIPCSVMYFCQDSQALNLLCTPSTINVSLHRRIKCLSLGDASVVDDVEEIAQAVWWPAANGLAQRPGTLRFDGEIPLTKNLKPSALISQFCLKYFVVMSQFNVTGFSPSGSAQPLIQQEVQIGTIFAKGPRARNYAPPS
ncbi:hypothetical protein FB45DRAFT_790452 [Roridomyces roridus]|uniref:Arrestin-like N-terminal domain-containing protein n=1 Tax=Roridomyces roridus TaxID=1738132 RepID=A0AAD7FNW4_9AGAR|nr:hypothetical protein FB45DRAFT_790452 [Roridomyces roridus]